MMVIKLSEYDGWTIDLKLRQFRKVRFKDNGGPEMLIAPFDSEEGMDIFKQYCDEQKEYHDDLSSGYLRMIFDLEKGRCDEEELDIIAEEMHAEGENNGRR
jgi:hypothetical protein